MVIKSLKEPLDKEGLKEVTNMELTELNITLSSLEIRGFVKKSSGKYFLNF